jgi:hypothetical protein
MATLLVAEEAPGGPRDRPAAGYAPRRSPGVPLSESSQRESSDGRAWHALLILAVSGSWEWLFVHHGLNRIDEGWVHYAAMQLHRGATLYRDVFFVFPPGHVLPAWLGQAWESPGLIATRVVYAALDVVLCLTLYALGRRLMAPAWALFGALLLAVAAPDSHLWHFLFGYRYAVLGVLALLCLAQRLARGERRWTFAAGLCLGTALCFRLTPAVSAGTAIAVALVAADPRPRRWLGEGALLAGGALLVALPVYAWLASAVGAATLWREILVRPVAMTAAQSLSIPDLFWPATGSRSELTRAFVALEFRAVGLLYLGYAAALARTAWRARRAGTAFPDALLLATVLWGAITFLRSLGRSDPAHLDSAIPPVCLLAAHALSRGLAWAGAPRAVAVGVAAFGFTAWCFALGVDVALRPEWRGIEPFACLDGRIANRSAGWARALDERVRAIRAWTRPDAIILDLTHSPLFYVLSGRRGPGGPDVIMPGTFASAVEEARFVERLEADPPALVIWPPRAFDDMRSRAIDRVAPQVTAWVVRRYRQATPEGEGYALLVPADAPDPPPLE